MDNSGPVCYNREVMVFFAAIPWLPDVASSHGGEVDRLFTQILVIVAAALILMEGFLLWCLLLYRKRPGWVPAYVRGERWRELLWMLIPVAVVVALDFAIDLSGERTWHKITREFPPAEKAIVVEVMPKQFEWHVRYPGRDGVFGKIRNDLATSESPWGIDPDDPAGKDDVVVINDMHVPLGRPVVVRLHARDVVHSFNVPAMRVRQDCVPGMITSVWFEPTRTGTFEIACSELCGLGHYKMRGVLTVESPETFESWLSEQAAWREWRPLAAREESRPPRERGTRGNEEERP